MKTYQHNGKWLTEVRVDPTSTFSRPATEQEIAREIGDPVAGDLDGDFDVDELDAELAANQPKRRGRPRKAAE